MGTCRGGISLWDHWNSTFCLLTWWKGSSSVLSSASQPVGSALYSHERPDAFDSVLLSFQDDDTKAKVSVISLSQQLSHVSLVHTELPLWHLFTQRKGSKKAQACPGSHSRGVASSSQCTPLHHVLEFIFSLVSCCCVINWSFIKKKKNQRPCDTVKEKLENVQLGTRIIIMQLRTYVMCKTNMLFSIF